MKNANRILIASTGWNGPRLTRESLPVGPVPRASSRPKSTKLASSGV